MLNVKTLAASAILTGAFVTAIPASATIGTEVQTQIQASQLNSQQGIAGVYEHLENVAVEECSAFGVSTIAERRTAKNCAENLLQDFIDSVDNDDLTQLFQIKTNG